MLALFLVMAMPGALASQISYDLPLWPAPQMTQCTTAYPPTPWDAYFRIYQPISVEMYFHSYGSSVDCNGFSIPGVSHTFTPYPGQELNYIWLDAYFRTDVREAVIRAYVDDACEGLTAHLAASPNQSNTAYLRTDDFLRTFELGFYKQTDYNDLYGYTRTRRIRNIGCYLCSCCNELQALGVNVDPPTLNTWLHTHGGYSRGDCVDPMAVVRYARTQGVNLGFVRNIALSEGMGRGLRCQVSVKNHRHWVTVPCQWLHVDNCTVYYLMNDPMYNVHHWSFLANYSGVDTNDTRCFYLKKSTQSGQSSSPMEAQEEQQGTQQLTSGTNDAPVEADWDGSSIYAATTSNVTLTLLKGGSVVAEDEEESLEDDETEELVTTSHVLTFPNAPLGDYELRIPAQQALAMKLSSTTTTAR